LFPDTDSLAFTASTLVLMAISLFFTVLLIRSSSSSMNKRLQKIDIKAPKKMEEVKKTVELPEISKKPKTSKKPKAAPPVKGCHHYLGYLEKLSTSSFPYECFACAKLRECVGEREITPKEVEDEMSEYRIATKIKVTIEKANNAPWKDLRGGNEQAIPRDEAPELYQLLKELGGRIKHGEWEYQCHERPLNMVVRTKLNTS